MNEYTAQFIVRNSLEAARERSNSGSQPSGFMDWLEGRCQAVYACADPGSALRLDALGAVNEICFLGGDYMRRHAK